LESCVAYGALMDDLLRDFVVETTENIDVVDSELVRFEQDPNNKAIIAQIFRLVHTIKGTCGFLGLPRLEALTHAAESAIDLFRDGAPVTRDAVSLILVTIDRIKMIMAELDRSMQEPVGEDHDLIAKLEAVVTGAPVAAQQPSAVAQSPEDITVGTLVYQVLERPLRPGEVSLDELEKAFRDVEAQEAEFDARVLAEAGLNKQPAAPEVAVDIHTAEAVSKKNSIRVPVDTLEHLMTMVSELVLTRNQLLEIARRDENSAFKSPLQRLSQVTAELQESVMKTRMQPIGSAWALFPRLIRDLCEELKKDIELETIGAETGIDRQLLEMIKDPMMHMIRNAADHGIETPGQRALAGKTSRGKITVEAAQKGGYIMLSIADDGRGLNLARVRAKAVELGLVSETEAAQMSDQQAAKFVFHPGFSTAEKLTNISGRGVGMDVVRTNIEQIGGSIDITTASGKGTRVDIKIPLTLAIAAALIIESCGQRFALPQMTVIELVRAGSSNEARIEHLHSAPVLRLRERLLPLMQLSAVLGLKQASEANWDNSFIVVCQVGQVRFGIVVDSVLQTEEIVVKPVSVRMRHLSCYSGVTILGDGSVIMILDPNGLLQHLGASVEAHNDNVTDRSVQASSDDISTTLLVFRAGPDAPKAIPLALVTRLEEIEVSRIEISNGQRMVQYRGKLMTLIPCQDGMILRESGSQPVLVFAHGGTSVGVIVDEIVDIVEDVLSITMESTAPGILGSAIIRERTTDIIDAAYFVPGLGSEAIATARQQRRLLLVESNDLFRAMLVPVVQAAGFQVVNVPTAKEAAPHLAKGAFHVIVANIESGNTADFAAMADGRARLVGIANRASRDLLEAARKANFDDVVGIFDREGLIASLRDSEDRIGDAA
jgi:two-component system, chemotaxis family, sensor kinase CheA